MSQKKTTERCVLRTQLEQDTGRGPGKRWGVVLVGDSGVLVMAMSIGTRWLTTLGAERKPHNQKAGRGKKRVSNLNTRSETQISHKKLS